MFYVALRLDTWVASGCRTDAGLRNWEGLLREVLWERPEKGAVYSLRARLSCPEGTSSVPPSHSPLCEF